MCSEKRKGAASCTPTPLQPIMINLRRVLHGRLVRKLQSFDKSCALESCSKFQREILDPFLLLDVCLFLVINHFLEFFGQFLNFFMDSFFFVRSIIDSSDWLYVSWEDHIWIIWVEVVVVVIQDKLVSGIKLDKTI